MNWRDLKPIPSEQWELEAPSVTEAAAPEGSTPGGSITLGFSDELSRQWFAEWLKSKRGWAAFMTWVDEKR